MSQSDVRGPGMLQDTSVGGRPTCGERKSNESSIDERDSGSRLRIVAALRLPLRTPGRKKPTPVAASSGRRPSPGPRWHSITGRAPAVPPPWRLVGAWIGCGRLLSPKTFLAAETPSAPASANLLLLAESHMVCHGKLFANSLGHILRYLLSCNSLIIGTVIIPDLEWQGRGIVNQPWRSRPLEPVPCWASCQDRRDSLHPAVATIPSAVPDALYSVIQFLFEVGRRSITHS